jgi:uncharacterized coiled-coil protein SlyX
MKKILKYLFVLGIIQIYIPISAAPKLPSKHLVQAAENLEMILVKEGSYLYHNKNKVTITKPFYLGKYEVTQAQWKEVLGSNPSKRVKNDKHPVARLNWHMVHSFVKKLNELERNAGRLDPNWEYDLPTQAEWEYACRAGTSTKYYWGNQANKSKSNTDKKIRQSQPVGSYSPNPWGFYDMYGNVWEYTKDSSGAWAGEVSGIDPVKLTGHRCIIRGGAHDSEASSSTKYAVYKTNNGDIQGNRGFRLALKKINGEISSPSKPKPIITPPTSNPGTPPNQKCKETIANLEKRVEEQAKEITALKDLVSKQNIQISQFKRQISDLTIENKNLMENKNNLVVQVNTITEKLGIAEIIAQTPFVKGWIYTPKNGWLHIDPKNYPIIYRHSSESWHLYELGSINPRYFYNYNEQEWEAWDKIEKN